MIRSAKVTNSNFILRGFKHFGKDTQNALDKWKGTRNNLTDQLRTLRANKELTQHEGELVDSALSKFEAYCKAFETLVDGRKTQEAAVSSRMDIHSGMIVKLYQLIKNNFNPAMSKAQSDRNGNALLELAMLERRLQEKVVQPFLMMQIDAEDAAAGNPLAALKEELIAWKQSAPNFDLSPFVESITGFFKNYEEYDQKYQDALILQEQANAEMVVSARDVEKILNDRTISIKARMFRMMSFSNVLGIILAASSVILGLSIAFFMTRSITKPIKQISIMIEDIAQGEGDLTKRLEISSKDEVGDLAKWFNLFVDKLQKMVQEIVVESRIVETSATELTAIANQMNQGSQGILAHGNQVAIAAEQMSGNMSSVAAAMEQAASNINTISSAVEQMSATIGEIAQNGSRASTVTRQAVHEAHQAVSKIEILGKAAEEIGKGNTGRT